MVRGGEGRLVEPQWSMRTLCVARSCSRRAARRSSSSTRTASCSPASRRARQSLGSPRGRRAEPASCCTASEPLVVPYTRRRARPERLVYLSRGGRSRRLRGAALGLHRRGLARAADAARAAALAARARRPARARTCRRSSSSRAREIDQIVELIDEVLFLAELESGTRVVSLGAEPVLPVLARGGRRARGAGGAGRRRAARRGRRGRDRGSAAADAPRRRQEPRRERDPLRRPRRERDRSRCAGRTARWCFASSTTAPASTRPISPRLFERFYRADRSRASRGTGLGLAIVKHVVASAGGTVEAHGGRGRGLEIRCAFPTPHVAASPPFHPIFTIRRPLLPDGRLEDSPHDKEHANDHENCAAAGPGSPARGLRRRARRRRRGRRHDRRLPAAAATSPAGSRRTAPAPSAPITTAAAERFQQQNAGVQVTVGVSGTGGGFERFCRGETDLSNASRPIRGRGGAACEDGGHRVRRVPGRERRAHGRRQQGQRLGRRA